MIGYQSHVHSPGVASWIGEMEIRDLYLPTGWITLLNKSSIGKQHLLRGLADAVHC